MMAARALEVDTVCKSYGPKRVLDSMTFHLREGELFGFVGGNGAGKTTTMRIILGVLDSDSGEIRSHGRPIDREDRRRIGYMPEERGLYPKMRVRDQLVFLARLQGVGKRAARSAAEEWLERFGLAERSLDNLDDLSLGNQQRVQLAAALVHSPEVLVLDEPFSGLDPMGVDVMSEVLREQAATGVPVLFSSHQLDLVERLCHRVGIVQGGRMAACGTVNELRSDAPRRLILQLAGAHPGWGRRLPGAELLGTKGERALLELSSHTDEHQVLDAAMRLGRVREFTPVKPNLTDMFRRSAGGASHSEARDESNGRRADRLSRPSAGKEVRG